MNNSIFVLSGEKAEKLSYFEYLQDVRFKICTILTTNYDYTEILLTPINVPEIIVFNKIIVPCNSCSFGVQTLVSHNNNNKEYLSPIREKHLVFSLHNFKILFSKERNLSRLELIELE